MTGLSAKVSALTQTHENKGFNPTFAHKTHSPPNGSVDSQGSDFALDLISMEMAISAEITFANLDRCLRSV